MPIQFTCSVCGRKRSLPPSQKRQTCSVACMAIARRQRWDVLFWTKVTKGSGCWIWNGKIDRHGYGRFGNGSKRSVLAHRLSWQFSHGPIPGELLVCHHCDVRSCVRPDHLFLGSVADNVADAVGKDRMGRGERNPFAKLTNREVYEIRALLDDGINLQIIAKRFGVQPPAIWKIKTGRSWAHL